MSLKDLKIPSASIKVGDSDFIVYPLTINRLTLLMQDYSDSLKEVFIAIQPGGEFDFSGLIESSGGFSNSLIALCSGEDDVLDLVVKLPINVQIQALQSIFELSFDGDFDLKKFCSLLTSGMKAATAGMTEIKSAIT